MNTWIYFLAGLLIEQQRLKSSPARKLAKRYVDDVGTYRMTPNGRVYISLDKELSAPKRRVSGEVEVGTDDLGEYVTTRTRGRHYVKILPNRA